MKCEEFAAVSYDLYVLGLLDPSETEELNRHVERHCPVCLRRVGRSMRLWSVFTSTLGSAEPSSLFKDRLQEITDLSKSVLTFPKSTEPQARTRLPLWLQVSLGSVIAALLAVSGWYAGHTSNSLERQQLQSRIAQTDQELTSLRLEMQEQQQQPRRSSALLPTAGQDKGGSDPATMQDRLLRLQAEVGRYKMLMNRKGRSEDEQKDILLLLSSPGAKLLPLKGSQASPASLAYAIIIPSSKLALFASNLSDLPDGREYQVWITSSSAAKPRSAGVFAPDETGHAYMQVDDGDVVSDASAIFVTEEPAGGSEAPTGSRILLSEE